MSGASRFPRSLAPLTSPAVSPGNATTDCVDRDADSMKIFTLFCHPNLVYDGDTIYGWVDQGLGTWNHGASRNGMGLRLNGLNAREHNDPGGLEARDALMKVIDTILTDDGSFEFQSVGWDKYSNRVEAIIPLPNGGTVNQWMIDHQWAAAWDGNGPKPLPPWPRTKP